MVADGATQTHESPHSSSRGPGDCGWELAQEKMRHMMVAGLTERLAPRETCLPVSIEALALHGGC